MMNQSILIGRIVDNPVMEKEGDSERCILKLAVQRSYKNEEGEYETDFINATLWNAIAQNVIEYCRKGDLVGVKGRLQNRKDSNMIELVAEKVTFLSSKPKEDKEEE